MSIKRYTVIFEEEHIGECETGKFVLYTDHLAAMEEKNRPVGLKYCQIHKTIVTKSGDDLTCCKIAALKEENLNLYESSTKTIATLETHLHSADNVVDRLKDQIIDLQATIKSQAEYNTLELARTAQMQEKVEALQAELSAVKTSKLVFVPELSDDMKDTEIERLEDRVKELEAALTYLDTSLNYFY
jgi:chromosome segregation ATPase